LHKYLVAAAAGAGSVLGDPALAEPCTIDALVGASSASVMAGMALALSGLTVTASMFVVRKWLWRYLGVYANDRLRRFGSIGLILAVLGIAGAAWSADATPIAPQIPEPWLRIGVAAAAALLGAIAVRAMADVIWGRDSRWGWRVRHGGSGIAALGLASVLLVQGVAVFHLDEKLGSIPRLKEIGSIHRIVQIFSRQ
jgi:hypothetical protein